MTPSDLEKFSELDRHHYLIASYEERNSLMKQMIASQERTIIAQELAIAALEDLIASLREQVGS